MKTAKRPPTPKQERVEPTIKDAASLEGSYQDILRQLGHLCMLASCAGGLDSRLAFLSVHLACMLDVLKTYDAGKASARSNLIMSPASDGRHVLSVIIDGANVTQQAPRAARKGKRGAR